VKRQPCLAAQGTSNTAGRQPYKEVASTVADDVMIAVRGTAALGMRLLQCAALLLNSVFLSKDNGWPTWPEVPKSTVKQLLDD
jgi:hypothetical protein